MTPEQILEKHLLIMLGRTEESYVSIEEIKKQPEWQATINAMLEYAEHKALSQHDVIKSVCLEGNEPIECDQFTALGNCEKCTHFNKQTVL